VVGVLVRLMGVVVWAYAQAVCRVILTALASPATTAAVAVGGAAFVAHRKQAVLAGKPKVV
jgi:hypothetical protein